MYFDDDLEMYVSEIDGIIFAREDEPTVDYEESLQDVGKNIGVIWILSLNL